MPSLHRESTDSLTIDQGFIPEFFFVGRQGAFVLNTRHHSKEI